MTTRRFGFGVALAAVCLLTGCHRHAPVQAVAPPAPPAVNNEPVMVSVPPPTHHSGDDPDGIPVRSTIPVVKPVKPPRRVPRKTQATTVAPQPTSPPPAQATATVAAASPTVNLGQLTSSTDDPNATRETAAAALRRERDRLAGVAGSVQSAHAPEIEQARRFLKSASDSWNAADYVATLALTTKARVLLDDLLK